MSSIRARVKRKGSVTQVKLLIRHPMETGLRKDSRSGKKIPAHFIQEVICKHNGNVVFKAFWGIAVSKNPYLSFTLADAKPGDKLIISWSDNQGKSDTKTVTV